MDKGDKKFEEPFENNLSPNLSNSASLLSTQNNHPQHFHSEAIPREKIAKNSKLDKISAFSKPHKDEPLQLFFPILSDPPKFEPTEKPQISAITTSNYISNDSERTNSSLISLLNKDYKKRSKLEIQNEKITKILLKDLLKNFENSEFFSTFILKNVEFCLFDEIFCEFLFEIVYENLNNNRKSLKKAVTKGNLEETTILIPKLWLIEIAQHEIEKSKKNYLLFNSIIDKRKNILKGLKVSEFNEWLEMKKEIEAKRNQIKMLIIENDTVLMEFQQSKEKLQFVDQEIEEICFEFDNFEDYIKSLNCINQIVDETSKMTDFNLENLKESRVNFEIDSELEAELIDLFY